MRNLFVKTALVLCTTIIFLPATVFATEPQNTEITSAEEGFTDSDPSVSYENDNSLTLDEKEDESTSTEPPSTEPPAEDEKTPDKADTIKKIRIRIFLHQEMTLVMVLNRILFML